MNQNDTYFTAVVTRLSKDKMFYSNHGVLLKDGIASLSESNKTHNYSTTKFESEQAVNSAVFQIVQSRNEIIESTPNFRTASSIEISIRCETKNSVKSLYTIKFR